MNSQTDLNEVKKDFLILIEKELAQNVNIKTFDWDDLPSARFVGTGGFGTVYKSHCTSLNATVALKTIKPDDGEYNNEIITAFVREVSIRNPSTILRNHLTNLISVEKISRT